MVSFVHCFISIHLCKENRRNSRFSLFMILFSVLVVTLLFSGCGYQMGSLTPSSIQTIAIPVFENQTLYRNFEFTLTKAVIEEVSTKTFLYIVSLDKADTILLGKIVKINQATVAKNEQRLATQMDVIISVEITWKNKRTGEDIFPPQILTETSEVFLERGETLELAINKAIEKIARQVIYCLESPMLL